MQPPSNPYSQPAYNQQQFSPQAAYIPPPQMPRGTVSLDVISEAWTFLKPNIGNWVLAMVVFFGIPYGISALRGVLQMLGQNGGSQIWTILAILLQVVSWGLTQLLTGGLAKMAIGTVRTRVANINEMWTVTNVWLGLLLTALLQGLLSLVAAIPGLIVLGVSVVGPLIKSGVFNLMAQGSSKAPPIPPSMIGAMIGGTALGVLLIVLLSIPLSSLLFLSTFLVVDRKVGPWEAISTSFGALKKHFWSAILLTFVLGLVNMAGALACCIGMLVSIPLTQIAVALVYRDLFGVGDAAPQTTVYAPPPIANPNF